MAPDGPNVRGNSAASSPGVGSAGAPARKQVARFPFPEGVLAGAVSAEQVVAQARAHPQQAAPLFEKGKVEAWYGLNGWEYPVETPPRTGPGAMEKYLEAIARSPPGRSEGGQPPAQAVATPLAKPASAEPPAPKPPQAAAARTTHEPRDSGAGLLRPTFRVGVLTSWAAFLGWSWAELMFGRSVDQDPWSFLLMTMVVAGAIGGGLSLYGFANLHWKSQLRRIGVGVAGSALGGLVGSYVGNLLYTGLDLDTKAGTVAILGRALGWTCMGIGIGIADGLHNRSWRKVRNGMIGGILGGFLGGILFDPLSRLMGSPVASRAWAFVLLGLCIGVCIALVRQLLKEAWLTVVEGFKPGRRLILTEDVSTLGTSEKTSLIFRPYGSKVVEPVHCRIFRSKGKFVVENKAKTGTELNGQALSGPTVLKDGDRIRLGNNWVRYNER